VNLNLDFVKTGWSDYLFWADEDRRTLKKINKLIVDVSRNACDGIGHPEQLKGNLSGWWSREIDKKNRLVYRMTEDNRIVIRQCKGHYDDK
jgi:toxin YoeB